MGWSECGIGNAECGKEGSWEDGKVGKKARLRDGETGFRQSHYINHVWTKIDSRNAATTPRCL